MDRRSKAADTEVDCKSGGRPISFSLVRDEVAAEATFDLCPEPGAHIQQFLVVIVELRGGHNPDSGDFYDTIYIQMFPELTERKMFLLFWARKVRPRKPFFTDQ